MLVFRKRDERGNTYLLEVFALNNESCFVNLRIGQPCLTDWSLRTFGMRMSNAEDAENLMPRVNEISKDHVWDLLSLRGARKKLRETVADVHGEDPTFTKAEWVEEVRNGDTTLGYWEWVEHQIESTYENLYSAALIDEMELLALDAGRNFMFDSITRTWAWRDKSRKEIVGGFRSRLMALRDAVAPFM